MQQHMKMILVNDEAIDAAIPQAIRDQYIETRDYALVEPFVHMVEQPTLFYLRDIPHGLFKSWVVTQAGDELRAYAAFQTALVRVENMRSDDGAVINDGDLGRFDKGVLKGMIRDEELERFDHGEILEIGDAAFMRNVFRRRTRLPCRLPPTLAEHLETQHRRRVALSRASQESNNSEASVQSLAATAP